MRRLNEKSKSRILSKDFCSNVQILMLANLIGQIDYSYPVQLLQPINIVRNSTILTKERSSTGVGMEAIEGLHFLASLSLAGTGRIEGGKKTQPCNRFRSRLFMSTQANSGPPQRT